MAILGLTIAVFLTENRLFFFTVLPKPNMEERETGLQSSKDGNVDRVQTGNQKKHTKPKGLDLSKSAVSDPFRKSL